MHFTKTITNKKGSILGKIKYVTMSDHLDTESAFTRSYYRRTSPRSRSSSPTHGEGDTAPRWLSVDQPAATVDYRDRDPQRRLLTSRESTPPRTNFSRAASPHSRQRRSSHARGPSREHHHSSSHSELPMIEVVEELLDSICAENLCFSDGCKPSYADNESFFPNPKVTFMVDQPRNLKCAICTETPLGLCPLSSEAGEDATMILPCGHSGCVGCLTAWLSQHSSCPFCRVNQVRRCGHAVEPRILALDTISSIPKVTAMGGKVAARCGSCRRRDDRIEAAERLRQLVDNFRLARIEVAETREEAAKLGSGATRAAHQAALERLERSQKEFERWDQDGKIYQVALASAW